MKVFTADDPATSSAKARTLKPSGLRILFGAVGGIALMLAVLVAAASFIRKPTIESPGDIQGFLTSRLGVQAELLGDVVLEENQSTHKLYRRTKERLQLDDGISLRGVKYLIVGSKVAGVQLFAKTETDSQKILVSLKKAYGTASNTGKNENGEFTVWILNGKTWMLGWHHNPTADHFLTELIDNYTLAEGVMQSLPGR